MRDEMVMVGENSPGFELPAEIACDRKEAAVQHTEPVRATEVMCLFVGAGGDEERAARRELMRRRMRPRSIRLGHGETLSRWRPHTQYWARVSGRPKAVEDYRTPRRFATIKAAGKSARSWTAPVLWRFGSSSRRTHRYPSGRRTPQVGKAVEDYRSPRRFATIKAAGKSARSWSAPVLWRFGLGIGLATGESSSQVYARSAKSGRGLPQSKTLRDDRGRRQVRQVLDCASPLALYHVTARTPPVCPSFARPETIAPTG